MHLGLGISVFQLLWSPPLHAVSVAISIFTEETEPWSCKVPDPEQSPIVFIEA